MTDLVEIEAAVRRSVDEVLELEGRRLPGDAVLLGDLGADSMELVDILFRVERSTGYRLDAAELSRHLGLAALTIQDLVDMVSGRVPCPAS
jgi:acyl carrier protein